jgi:hypothetical protein
MSGSAPVARLIIAVPNFSAYRGRSAPAPAAGPHLLPAAPGGAACAR